MFSRRTCKGGKEKLWDLAAKPLHGPGRRFVTGVAAGICRRPDDRPSAETHPPNNSMNVYLVDSRSVIPPGREPWRFLFCSLLLRRPSRRPALSTRTLPDEARFYFNDPPDLACSDTSQYHTVNRY